MTLAAGMKFNWGILLCADTEMAYGGVQKVRGEKLFAFHLSARKLKIGFAIAGSVPDAKVAIRKIMNAIEDADASVALTPRAVLEATEQSLAKIHNERVYPHPNFQRDGSPEFWLVIAFAIDSDPPHLYVTYEDRVTPIDKFESIGSGDYLFRYVFGPGYDSLLNEEEAIILATHALRETKSTVPGVGFGSEFRIYSERKHDFSTIGGYDISHVEDFSAEFKRAMYDLLFNYANLTVGDGTLEEARTQFINNLTSLRKEYLKDKVSMVQLKALLHILHPRVK
ncbi:MAG: hypothetical protein LAN63_16010 [Acidobacteriia bacterium]|nr:hypothetical protein [Terriglobia bacterium]